MNERVIKIIDPYNSRIVVISDVHGGLSLLDQLIKKAELKPEDYLIILGDFLQRGYQNIETLAYIRSLLNRPKTHVLSGNHEHYLCRILEEHHLDRLSYHLNHIHYGCILREWMYSSKMGFDALIDLQMQIKSVYRDDLYFLKTLPFALEINDHLFVHAGIKDLVSTSSHWDLLSTPEFYEKNHGYSGTVVVGHWPVQNYKKNSLSGEVLIDLKKRIIAIDGGYGVKSSGQMNALIIHNGYKVIFVDDLDVIELKDDIEGKNTDVVKLDYDDKDFVLLEKGEEFSKVRKISTGEVFLLINDYLNQDFEDYVSYFISGKKGERGGLIKRCATHSLIKLNGQVGWLKNCLYHSLM